MSHSEVIVFIALLCAVKAAVTVDVYEDDVDTVKTERHAVESCDNASCSTVCRMLGFNTGSCVGDTCECRKQRVQKDGEQLQGNDTPSLGQDNITGNGLERCDPNACYQLCRRLKFPSGTCINGRCRCDNFQNEPDQLERNDIHMLDVDITGKGLEGCDPNACYQLCRRLKFPSGTCINGRCRCDNFQNEPDQLERNDIHRLDVDITGKGLEGCDPNACYQLCRRLKFPSGTCINGRCKCDYFLNQPDQLEQNDIHRLDVDVAGKGLEGCDPNACYRLCRRLKFPSGTCINGRCKCDYFPNQPDQLEQNDIHRLDVDVTGKGLEGCDPNACYRLCRRLKFPSGTCINGRCKCDYFLNQPDQLEQNDIHRLDVDVTGKGLEGCDPNACYRLCRRLKFPSGTCINGRCKCDYFLNQPETMIQSLDREAAKCNNVQCNQICHRLGFRHGMCVGVTCRCSNVLRTVLEISLSQDISVDIDNSLDSNDNIIVTKARECDQLACVMGCRELGFPGGSCFMGKCRCNKGGNGEEDQKSLRACNSAACNRMCLRLNYHGGWCRFGRCECF